ncbi:MAG: N-6 DNA methylase [Armatimonadota bacterium]
MPQTRAELGQFFTPRTVIDTALAILHDLGAEIAGVRVCDPACGPGEWLQGALGAGAEEALGIDCDPAMIGQWQESGLAADARCRLMVGDGLLPALELAGTSDLVLGNPPFGAELPDLREEALCNIARHYRLARRGEQPRLFASPSAAEIERIRRFPTEVLFLERFVEICRPDGWVAIVLPEGLFANRRWRHAREWLLREMTVHVVAALPRITFRAHATTARTCLMLMQHRPPSASHETALCEVQECTPRALGAMREALRDGVTVTDRLDLLPPIFSD